MYWRLRTHTIERMDAWFKADALRAAQYDNMLKELDVALEKWLPNLSNAQRKDVYDALDWYHIGKLQSNKKGWRSSVY